MFFSTVPVRRRPPRGTPQTSPGPGVSSPEPSRETPSFEDVVVEHTAFIHRTVTQLGVPSRDLEDVAQAVREGIARGLPAFDPSLSSTCAETALRGWIFGICERQARSYRRQQKKRPEVLSMVEALDARPDARPGAEQRILARERHALLARLLAWVKPDRRAVLVAYDVDEMPMAEVAAVFGIPVNTAWNRRRLALEELRAAWRRMAAGERG